jgi:serine/threonine protein kinase
MKQPSLSSLLVRWAEAFEQGQDLAAEQLCPDDPERAAELARHIERLRRQRRQAASRGPGDLTDTGSSQPCSPEATEGWPGHGPPPAAQPLPEAPPGYEIVRELGRGGMGVVYLARQAGVDRLVALKMIRTGPWTTPEQRQRLLREARLVAGLDHPGIVRIHAVGEQQGRPFLALEYVPGGSLRERPDGKPWAIPEAVRLVEQLARAVHHAHLHGVVHRDLKPGNVLLSEDGCPRIADFGLAHHVADPHATQSGAVLGTPQYMAPEQASGKVRETGPATDVHALGVILYELLTGRRAFAGASLLETLRNVRDRDPVPPRRLRREVSLELEAVCLRCLAKDPARRYPDAEALAEDLDRLAIQGPGAPSRRRRWLLAGALVACCGLVAGAAALLLPSRPKAPGSSDPPEQAGQATAEPPKKVLDQAARPPNKILDQPAVPAGVVHPNLDLALLRAAPQIALSLSNQGYRSVGVLPFQVQKGARPASYEDAPLSAGLPGRLENALVMTMGDDESKALAIIRNAAGTASQQKVGSWTTSKAAFDKLFSTRYPLAWGKRAVRPDVFLTGVVSNVGNRATTTVDIHSFTKSSRSSTGRGIDTKQITRLVVKTDRALLRDLGYRYALGREMLKRGTTVARRNQQALDQVRRVEETGRLDQGPDNIAGMKFEILYNNVKQTIRPLYTGQEGAMSPLFQVDLPRVGDRVRIVLTRLDRTSKTLGVVLKVAGKSTWQMEDGDSMQCKKWLYEPDRAGKPDHIDGFYMDTKGAILAFDRRTQLMSAAKDARETATGVRWIDVDVFAGGEELQTEEQVRPGTSGLALATQRPETLKALRRQVLQKNKVRVRRSTPVRRSESGMVVEELEHEDGGFIAAAGLANLVRVGGISIRCGPRETAK